MSWKILIKGYFFALYEEKRFIQLLKTDAKKSCFNISMRKMTGKINNKGKQFQNLHLAVKRIFKKCI